MIERIIDLSDQPARLSVRLGLLVLDRRDVDEVTVPMEDVAVLVVSHRQVVYTHAVLACLAKAGGVFVACDEQHMPAGLMLPIAQHHLHAERCAHQAEVSLPTKKRLWQTVVAAKIRAQGRLLDELHHNDRGLGVLAQRVRSGDPDNIEGQAARRYWPALFAPHAFRRDREAADQNRLLNYGYSILRAVIARAICAAGLHPGLGIHHHNRYDAFCLADDLMEPFRPVVDHAVARHVWENGPEAPLDKAAKTAVLSALMHGRFTLESEERSLFDIATRTTVSLARVFMGEEKQLLLPEL